MSESIEQIIKDWEGLDKQHKEFVLRVASRGENKHGAEPLFIYPDNTDEPVISLWAIPEEMNFIKTIGSYKFSVTSKFEALRKELFGV